MITLHAQGENGPVCHTTLPDSSGHIATTSDESKVDCGWCAEALGLHVCGVSDLNPSCDGCRVLGADAGVGRLTLCE